MAPQIPDRWLNYQPIGERVEGTRFIAFKVPLREHINKTVKDTDRLHGKLLLEKVPNLGVIIDLTNTHRYYDPNFFRSEGIEHMKLMIPGKMTPSKKLVDCFKDFVKDFLKNNPDNDKLIGVHCTHGVNRTGYLICHYMVSEMAIDPVEAIKKFADARGHKIERQNYLDSLHTLSSPEIQGIPTKDNILPEDKFTSNNHKTEKSTNSQRTDYERRAERSRNWSRHSERNERNNRERSRSRSRSRNNSKNDRHQSSSSRQAAAYGYHSHRNPRNEQERDRSQSRYSNYHKNAGQPHERDRFQASRRNNAAAHHHDNNHSSSSSYGNANRFKWQRGDNSVQTQMQVDAPVVTERKRKAFDDDIRDKISSRHLNPPASKIMRTTNNTPYQRYNNNFQQERHFRDSANHHNDDYRNRATKRIAHTPRTSSAASTATNRPLPTDYHNDSRTNSKNKPSRHEK